MRVRADEDEVSVHAIAGTHVVLLGLDVVDGSAVLDDLLGFAVHKTNCATKRTGWIPGFKTFKPQRGHRAVPAGTPVSTLEHPVQGFLWGDYAARADQSYVYKIVPMYGRPGALERGRAVEVEVQTESESSGRHAVYFNRGAAASQAYARKFKNRSPDTVGRRAFEWLSRGLEKALIDFIGQARGRGWALRAALYEFHYVPIAEAFRAALDRSVDVQIIYDAKRGEGKPGTRNAKTIRQAGLDNASTPRCANSSYIAHNKFIVLVKDSRPVEVWTGSTNITEGGIFGHSNLAHVIRGPAIARAYLDYWKTLRDDPPATVVRAWTEAQTPVPGVRDGAGLVPIFSPRASLEALEHYARLMDRARSSVFLTAAFGVNPLLREVLARDKPYLRYLLFEKEDKADPNHPDIEIYKRARENLIAVGSHLSPNVLERWVQRRFAAEELTGKNKHVKYVHTKYMLIDPLDEEPIVITGSANFSNASTRNNDENMVIIRGDPRVADIYLGEFMRLYTHYRFRWIADRARRSGRPRRPLYLKSTDAWLRPYYEPGSVKMKERRLFG